jgi:hypothetical protein
MIIEIANKNFDSNYNQKQEKNIHNTLDTQFTGSI